MIHDRVEMGKRTFKFSDKQAINMMAGQLQVFETIESVQTPVSDGEIILLLFFILRTSIQF